MGADNVVLLFILVWTFTSVCHGNDDVISVICEDVTGTVGEEVTLTCSVSQSLKCTKRCIMKYKFKYPEINESEICKEEFPQDSCEQRNSFTCRFTPTTAMTGQFRFFVETQCGLKQTEFTVTITDDVSVNCEDVTGTVGEEVTVTCSVSHCIESSIIKFQNPEGDSICKQWLPQDSCEQRNSFTCRFTPTTAMTEQFRFFVQTQCGRKTTEFPVTITEHSKHETVTEDPGRKDPTGPESLALIMTGAVVVCSIFIIIFIIIMTILCVKRFRHNTPSGVQMKYERSASAEPTMTTVNVQSETK